MDYARNTRIVDVVRCLAAALNRDDHAILLKRAINTVRFIETGERDVSIADRRNIRLTGPEACKLAISVFATEAGLGSRQMMFPLPPDDLRWPRADELAAKRPGGWVFEVATGRLPLPGETRSGPPNAADSIIRHLDDPLPYQWQVHTVSAVSLFWLPAFMRSLADGRE